VWARDGYRDTINARIARDQNNSEINGVGSFEQYFAQEYHHTFDALTNFVVEIINHFEKLKETLQVKIDQDKLVKPVVFPNNHSYLQPNKLQKIIEAVLQAVRNIKELC
jgi:hypothetical protein